MHQAKKRFGQNFLQDPAVILHMMQAINPQPEEPVIEIGPGTGVLTQQLISRTNQLTALEIDADLATKLQRTYQNQPHCTLLHTDALHYDWQALAISRTSASTKLRILGNLPYNIATALITRILKANIPACDCHFMVQKEVAERMIAKPGNTAYGYLSVLTHYFATVDYLFTVPPQAFVPKPKVDSAVIRLYPRTYPIPIDSQKLDDWLKLLFTHKRKTIRNNIGRQLAEECLKSLDAAAQPMLQQRAEQLDLAQLIHLITQL